MRRGAGKIPNVPLGLLKNAHDIYYLNLQDFVAARWTLIAHE
jgi:hypothetical protein